MKSPSLRSIVTAVGAGIALVTATLLPTGYSILGYLHLSQHLDLQAESNANYLAIFLDQGTPWQLQTQRIAELMGRDGGSEASLNKRILDSSNKVVFAKLGSHRSFVMRRRRAVILAGAEAGHVEVEASLWPLVQGLAVVASLSTLLGLGIFFALRIYPLRVLDRTFGQLELSNQRLAQINGLFDAALDNMSHGLTMFDAEGRLLVFNARYAEMLDLPPELVKTGTTLLEILQYRAAQGQMRVDPIAYWAKLQVLLKEGKPSSRTVASSRGRTIAVSHTPMSSGGWVSIHEDITEQRAAEAKLAHMALHDALTNLPNRLLFREQMETHLGKLEPHEKAAVLCFDLDGFKNVNDTLGHPIGDKLLQLVADRMRKCLREGDTLARLGGHEFAIMQTRVNQARDAYSFADLVIKNVDAPFEIDGHQVAIGVSIGIALAPDDATDPEQLLKNADVALYRAKADGKGTYRFFEPEIDLQAQAPRALDLDIRKAIVNGEFEIHYQPIVDLATEQTCCFEALLRWNHPERGLIPPLDFIPFAEVENLIVPIDEWVIRKACEDAARWPEEIRLSVNLSPAHFRTRNIIQTVMSALANSGRPANRLDLEITESVLLVDNASTIETLNQLRNLGVRISLDDFGTGYSSLKYLRSFPFDKIKIDRSFVHDFQRSEASKAVIRAVVGLGSSLGMTTTGEGVETREEADYLRQEGCTEAQGYYFGKAMPLREVRKTLAKSTVAVSAVA